MSALTIGLHTVLLSKLAGKKGKLCVFEPNTELLPQLTVTLEGLGNAVLFPFALSNKSEVATLYVPENAEMGSLADWTAGRDDVGTTHTIDCEVRRLDDLVDAGIVPRPDYIKCDAEGAELLIFQGGEKTLNRAEAPIILFEANVHNARGFGLALDDAKNYLANVELPQYRFFEIQESESLIPIITPHPIHSNILAVPLSKLDRIANLTIGQLSR